MLSNKQNRTKKHSYDELTIFIIYITDTNWDDCSMFSCFVIHTALSINNFLLQLNSWIETNGKGSAVRYQEDAVRSKDNDEKRHVMMWKEHWGVCCFFLKYQVLLASGAVVRLKETPLLVLQAALKVQYAIFVECKRTQNSWLLLSMMYDRSKTLCRIFIP